MRIYNRKCEAAIDHEGCIKEQLFKTVQGVYRSVRVRQGKPDSTTIRMYDIYAKQCGDRLLT